MFTIDKTCSGANISRTIRFTEEIFDILANVSIKNNVSFNLLVLQCCKYELDNLDEKQKC